MKKKDLMNGDIVVLRSGLVGVVIINNDTSYLMFQTAGWEDLDFYYDDDMVYLYPDDDNNPDAIMQVYRSSCGFSFSDYTDDLPLYERDRTWVKPTEAEMKKRADELKAAYIAEREEAQK